MSEKKINPPPPVYAATVMEAVKLVKHRLHGYDYDQIIVIVSAPIEDRAVNYFMDASPMRKMPVYVTLRDVAKVIEESLLGEVDEALREAAAELIGTLIKRREAEEKAREN